MMGVRSATARTARRACSPVASGSPRSSSTRSYSTVCSRSAASVAVWTTSTLTWLRPASFRCLSTTRASAGSSSTNNNRMLLISNSLVLIGALTRVTGCKPVAQPFRPFATAGLSASDGNSLGSGDELPVRAKRITYRPGGPTLKPYGGEFARRLTKYSRGFHPDCLPAADWVGRQTSYDQSIGKNHHRVRARRWRCRPRVRAAPGAFAAVHARRPGCAGKCCRAADVAHRRGAGGGCEAVGFLAVSCDIVHRDAAAVVCAAHRGAPRGWQYFHR